MGTLAHPPEEVEEALFVVNGAWNSTSGPNAPFHNTPGWGYGAGFVEGIQSWNAAGVPYKKLAGGIPFYGRAQTLSVDSAPKTQYNPAVSPNAPLGDQLDGPWQDAYCSSDSQSASGVWRWAYLRSQGILTSPTTASLTTFNEIDMTNLMSLRADYKDAVLKKHGVKFGFMSAFVKAAAVALEEIPAVNASIDGNEIVYHDFVDMSVAVSTPKGLVTPVLRNVEEMGYLDIERGIAELGKKVCIKRLLWN